MKMMKISKLLLSAAAIVVAATITLPSLNLGAASCRPTIYRIENGCNVLDYMIEQQGSGNRTFEITLYGSDNKLSFCSGDYGLVRFRTNAQELALMQKRDAAIIKLYGAEMSDLYALCAGRGDYRQFYIRLGQYVDMSKIDGQHLAVDDLIAESIKCVKIATGRDGIMPYPAIAALCEDYLSDGKLASQKFADGKVGSFDMSTILYFDEIPQINKFWQECQSYEKYTTQENVALIEQLNPMFDVYAYYWCNRDLQVGIGPNIAGLVQHYVTSGYDEIRGTTNVLRCPHCKYMDLEADTFNERFPNWDATHTNKSLFATSVFLNS